MNGVAQIGPSIRIKGNITAQEPLTIAGEVVGNIDVSGHQLVVTEAARVTADIVAHTLVIGGFVTGKLCAEGGVVVQHTATVAGEMSAPSISVSDGAQLQARFQIAGRRGAAAA
jgi:cytoskeletal protein CcmA (bactofilin family)